MAHARKQIRDAAAAAVTGLATTGGNVFVGRATRVPASELPALLVYTARGEEGGEEAEPILAGKVEGELSGRGRGGTARRRRGG